MSGENKEQTFTFPDRWQAYIEELPAEEVKALMIAMCRHAFGGEAPADLSLAVRMAMVDVRSRIDWERGVKEARANAGKASGRARNTDQQRPTPTNKDEQTRTNTNKGEQTATNDQQTGTNANTPKDRDRDRDRDIKKTTTAGGGKRKAAAAAFLSWTPEDFRKEAAAAVKAHPEYAPHLDAFCDYWLQEHRNGGPRFKAMEAFSMAGRFATWKRRQEEREAERRPAVVLHPVEGPQTTEEALEMLRNRPQ